MEEYSGKDQLEVERGLIPYGRMVEVMASCTVKKEDYLVREQELWSRRLLSTVCWSASTCMSAAQTH